jgi:hypothetical protein
MPNIMMMTVAGINPTVSNPYGAASIPRHRKAFTKLIVLAKEPTLGSLSVADISEPLSKFRDFCPADLFSSTSGIAP